MGTGSVATVMKQILARRAATHTGRLLPFPGTHPRKLSEFPHFPSIIEVFRRKMTLFSKIQKGDDREEITSIFPYFRIGLIGKKFRDCTKSPGIKS